MDNHHTKIFTTRFNNISWKICFDYRIANKLSCVYAPASEISRKSAALNELLYVIEMNNDTNTIMGVGLIRNIPTETPCGAMYKNTELYSSTYYIGKNWVSRDELIELESENFILTLEKVLFFGSTHSKRGHGITAFPIKALAYHQCETSFNPWLTFLRVFTEKYSV